MICFEEVSKVFPGGTGEAAIADLTLRIEPGEMVFILGQSGAGKSTLLKLITLEQRPTRGRVTVGPFDSETITRRGIPHLRRHCGVVFQDFRLIKDKTIFENVAYCLRMTGTLEKLLITRAVSRVLHRVGIYGKRDRFPHELSGGEQQRAAIGRALIHQPPVLLADEPTGNLDAETGRDVLEVLAQLHLSGTTILVATHDEELARRYATRTLTLRNGRVVEDLFLRPHGTEVF
ncbi:MAG: ATP-binding cassette domain-containing protein [Candidatus Eisenbacteria sp.]|nr:ATP-binding cassette domain-containing protein [Candidatus Eisenbacteria bacterium]